jgi:tetratricopeptide (TPR) repeat protein
VPDCIALLLDAYAQERAGDRAGAEASVRAVLAEQPDQPMALHLLGVLALRAGRAREAVVLLEQARSARPDNADTILALADALATAGDPAAAITHYRTVLQCQPGRADASINFARALCQVGEPQQAVNACRAALAVSPGLVAAQAALASALLHLGDPDAALAAADAVLLKHAQSAEALFVRGTACSALGRGAEAVAALCEATKLRPDDASAWLNLGNAYADRDQLDDAERCMREALARDPALPEAHASLGWLLTGHGRLAEAVAACDAALRLRPGFARAHWNRSFAHLLAGNYFAVWEDYEWRRRHERFAQTCPVLPGREWRGEVLTGQHLLVAAAQGLGDTILCARYLPTLAARAARVTLLCADPLVPLLRQLAVGIVPATASLPRYDCWVDQMSLPRLLGATPKNLPAASGYLTASPSVLTDLPPGLLHVGLVWAGNPAHSNDFRRSMPAAALLPLLQVPAVALVSLQVGPRGSEARLLGIPDRSGSLPDFAATASVVAGLDLVIAVDTAIAHLAGALGKPVSILLPYAPDWRWILGRDDSPWYASARLFRQPLAGDWTGVVARVGEALRNHAATWRQNRAPTVARISAASCGTEHRLPVVEQV